MKMALLPQLSEFHLNMNWETYQERFQQYVLANKIENERQVPVFLSVIGEEAYTLLRNLCFPSKPWEKSLDELHGILKNHLQPATSIIAERFKFRKCIQGTGESVGTYVSHIKQAAMNCQFGNSLNDSLRDQFVCGLLDKNIQRKLLEMKDITFNAAVEMATAAELVRKESLELASSSSSDNIHVVHKTDIHSQSQRSDHFSNTSLQPAKLKSCPGCGTNHSRSQCKFRTVLCRKCNKRGHLASVCLSPNTSPRDVKSKKDYTHFRKSKQQQTRNHNESVNSNIECVGKRQVFVSLIVNGRNMDFQLDTGATCSMVGLDGYRNLGFPRCIPANRSVKAYGNKEVPIKGEVTVSVTYHSKTKKLPLLIVNTKEGGNIFGLDWFNSFNFTINDDVQQLVQMNNELPTNEQKAAVEALCMKHDALFEPVLGKCNSYTATIHLKPNAHPKFHKARPIPFSQMDVVKAEIDRLTNMGIWKPIKTSEWAAPIVVVPKPNSKIRICGDFKVTVNPQIQVDQYPIPRPEELFNKLRNGKHFTKIDLSDAYLQLELDESSKKLLVVNTPQGLFEYQRLPFGVASAPAIFQRLLEQIISGLPGCANYLDDIIVTGKDDEEHIKALSALFQRLEENGLRCNKQKCMFFEKEVAYLGYIISEKGIRPSDTGIEAIRKLPRPKNIQELQSFLGKLNYYGKFVEGFSQIASPLNALRRKGTRFTWNSQHDSAFQELKDRIVNATRLVHYDPDLPLMLATDASSYGIGAVLSHRYPDGTEKPIAYASKTLTETQRRYSQIEKEALSIIYGVKKFHQYVYGRKFELITDHKPLISIFNPNQQLPIMTAQRIQRWAIILMGYEYTIRFRPTEKHSNADALSRLPIGPDEQFDTSDESCFSIDVTTEEDLMTFPVNFRKIEKAVQKDPVLRRVHHYVRNGWPDKLPEGEEDLQPFFERSCALTLHSGVVILQTEFTRVVIPATLRDHILKLLHEGHWGMVRMKQMARRYCWWPRIDKAIEELVRRCKACQCVRANPRQEYEKWPETNEPWERLHIDFAGPFWDSRWLICVDAYSRFPYVTEMKSTTAEATVAALRNIFMVEGLPSTIVSDNGTQFSGKCFRDFCNSNDINHFATPPFHPASNGEAERFIRTFKEGMKKAFWGGEEKREALEKLLISYRTTPFSGNKSPAEMLHGRQPKTLLSLITPPLPQSSQTKEIKRPNPHKFQIEEPVYVKNYYKGPDWIPGVILKFVGNMIYEVKTSKGLCKRHQNQIRKRFPSFRGSEQTK